MIPEIRGRTIAFVGPLEHAPFRAFARLVRERGGRARRGLRGANVAAVVIGARTGVPAVAAALEAADAAGALCVSERALLRALGILRELSEERPFAAADIGRHARLEAATVRLLSVLGILDPWDGRFSFRDLAAARAVARTLGEGADLEAIVRGAGQLRSAGRTLSDTPVAAERRGGLLLRFEGRLAELNGQLRIPGILAPAPVVDDLVLAAEDAEEAGDWASAERLYRESLRVESSDPGLLFNLGNVLREDGRLAEAQHAFLKAISADPDFPEAWYNLAGVAEARNRKELALACLRRAVKLDPSFVDARMNLARLLFLLEHVEEAAAQWQACLGLSIPEDLVKAARRGLHACRMRARTPAG